MKKQRTYTAREIEKLVTQRAKELNTKKSKTPQVTKLSNNPREKLLRKQLFKDLEVKFGPFKKALKAKKVVAKVAKVVKKPKKKSIKGLKSRRYENMTVRNPKKRAPLVNVGSYEINGEDMGDLVVHANVFKSKKEKTKKKDSSNFLLKILNSFKRKGDK